MILSRRHRFILVRGRKVAGTSVETALSTLCGPEDIASPMVPADELRRQAMGGFCGNYSDDPAFEQAYLQLVRQGRAGLRRPAARYKAHMPLAAIEAEFGPVDGFRVIGIERDPYARVISALGGVEYLAGRLDSAAEDFLPQLRSIWRYRNRAGELVATALRYERLQADLDAFLGALGIAPIALPHAKPGILSNRIDPTQVFRRDQIDKINAVMAEEFAFGGYQKR
jgi:hypothetical protein